MRLAPITSESLMKEDAQACPHGGIPQKGHHSELGLRQHCHHILLANTSYHSAETMCLGGGETHFTSCLQQGTENCNHAQSPRERVSLRNHTAKKSITLFIYCLPFQSFYIKLGMG